MIAGVGEPDFGYSSRITSSDLQHQIAAAVVVTVPQYGQIPLRSFPLALRKRMAINLWLHYD
jgi:hypothetical protein